LGSKHPKYNNFIYPVNYGYIPNAVAGDGEEIDAYILREDIQLAEYEGRVIAIIHRKNDNEDKLVVSNGSFTIDKIKTSLHFQKQYFEIQIIIT
jgi:inorganic pyrophosphatase